ncbi:phosphotransferase [Nocardia sp. NPDC004415]
MLALLLANRVRGQHILNPLPRHGINFWVYYPQDDREEPPARALGALLRQLHQLPAPPFALPSYLPLAGLRRALALPGALREADRAWLVERSESLIAQYEQLDSHLGVGMVHGDAYTGNTLWNGDQVRLGDWDEISSAPRELDLINTFQGVRYGVEKSELDEFADAYGWDAREWSGFTVLQDMRDLHTLTGFIRRAAREPAAAAQLELRIATLRDSSDTRLWRAAT